jgi:hypothetical protein
MTPLQMYLSMCACFILEEKLSLNMSKQLATCTAVKPSSPVAEE